MSVLTPTAPAYVAVGAASAQFATVLDAAQHYVVASSVDAWIAVGANPTAVARTAGNHFVPADTPVTIRAAAGAKVAIIRDDIISGHASLSEADPPTSYQTLDGWVRPVAP